jgi:site-specific DNA-methyltransferase (adenine-specific)
MKTRTKHNHPCHFDRAHCFHGKSPVAPSVARAPRNPKCNLGATIAQIVPRVAGPANPARPNQRNHKRFQLLTRSAPDRAEQLGGALADPQFGQKSGLSEDPRKVTQTGLHKKLHNAHLCNLSSTYELINMHLELHHGDCRPVMRTLASASVDACITDPPYGDTSLEWDKQIEGWVEEVARVLKPAASIWIFGSMRFLAPLFHKLDSLGFKYSQDIVWEKQNGTGFHNDRFRRVHEHAVMFYRGTWADVYHDTQYTLDATAKTVRRKARPTHTGNNGAAHYVSEDGGPRMMRSVLYMPNEHGRALHPTQKPVEICTPLLRYSVPPGGVVLDPFMGSASIGMAARIEGRGYIGIEQDPEHFTTSQRRMDGPLESTASGQPDLFAA